MIILPISTELHDGKIRLAAIEIILLCFIVHLIVSNNTSHVEKEIQNAIIQFKQKQSTELTNGSFLYFSDILTRNNDLLNESELELKQKINSLRKSVYFYKFGFVPDRFNILTLFTSMFIHGSWMHLIGNILFFYVCGIAMEKFWGFWRFFIIYISCGIGANFFYMFTSIMAGQNASSIPLIGASGAIAGVMGAFLITHGQVKIKILFIFLLWFRKTFFISSYLYLGFWFFSQIAYAVLDIGHESGVAYSAHIGGFVLGAILAITIKGEHDSSQISTSTLSKRIRLASDIKQYNTSLDNSALQDQVSADPLLTQGWEAFRQGNYNLAVDILNRAIDGIFLLPDNKVEISENITNILKYSRQLNFSSEQIYYWAKVLTEKGMGDLALKCYDLAAQTASNLHIQKNSLFHSAKFRMKSGLQIERAVNDFKKVVSLDSNGILSQQAYNYLNRLKYQ